MINQAHITSDRFMKAASYTLSVTHPLQQTGGVVGGGCLTLNESLAVCQGDAPRRIPL